MYLLYKLTSCTDVVKDVDVFDVVTEFPIIHAIEYDTLDEALYYWNKVVQNMPGKPEFVGIVADSSLIDSTNNAVMYDCE